MASATGRTSSSIFEGWERWQIAVAVGAPICLGLAGLWYYKRSQKSSENVEGQKPKVKPKSETPTPTKSPAASGSGTKQEGKNDTPLAKAQTLKNSGNKFFKEGKYDEAIRCYTEALEICPKENSNEIATFYANRAAAYEKLKNPKQVFENCTEAIKLNGKYTKALNRRACAAEQLGELQTSLEDVTAVCILEGFSNQVTLQMADRVLKNLGKAKAKEALQVVEKGIQNKKPAMPSKHFVKSYFEAFTQDPVQMCLKTQHEEKVSNLQEPQAGAQAENQIDTGAAGDQPSVNGDKSSSFQQACKMLQKGEYEEIIPLCDVEIEVTPPTHHRQLAILLRGTMYCLRTQFDEALIDLDSLLKEETLDKKIKVNALIKRGSLYITREQQVEGLDDFARAARIDPKNSDVFHHRGHQNIQLDRLEDAIKDFESSISLNPNFPNSYIQKAYAEHRRAAAEQSTMKLEKAIKSYEDTLKSFPNNADGHALYAQALCDLGRFDDADNEFEMAIKLEPDNANTLVHRALLKLQWKQDIEEPVALIKQAIDLDDKCEYAYEILGTIEVQKGDMVKAVGLFEKAIELCRTETEMSHLFSLLHAAKAQLKAAQILGIQLPSNFSPM